MTELYESYLYGTHEEIVETAKHKLAAIKDAVKLLDENEFKEPDLFYSAYAVCIYYLYALTEHETVEEWTGGDVLMLIDKSRKTRHTAAQQPYLDLYYAALSREGADASLSDRPEDERKLILGAKDMAIKDLTDDGHSVCRRENGVLTLPFKKPKFVTGSQSEEDKLLSEISLVLKKAMTLFEKVPDGASGEAFYRYLRTAYERLQNYSQVVGNKDVAVECIERITEITDILDHINAEQPDEGKSTAGLRTLLGLKMKKEGSYDVFISYKHENKEIAGRMYAFCEMLHLSTFVDFKTLPELSNSEYEEAIMSALEKSKHFVVILTDLSQLEAHWIKLEMKIFEHEISEGRKDGSNFIMVVSDDVFDEVISSNKRCIPIRYRSFEIMRISDYREMLGSYLT